MKPVGAAQYLSHFFVWVILLNVIIKITARL